MTPTDFTTHPRAVPLVRMKGIGKRFGSVQVLEDVDFEVAAGEVHILAGENGAGKSTLIKVLGGVYRQFEGTIEIEGEPVRPRSPLEANALGVAVIFQELSLIPSMTVADNIFLRNLITRVGFVSDQEQQARTRVLLAQLGIPIDVRRRVEDLSIAEQQLVEIAKALVLDARVIVMDEPTSALNAPEVEKLFGLVQALKERGCGIVYITHKMEEIERIADRITVLRDGRRVGTAWARDLPPASLIEWMVGSDFDQLARREATATEIECLRLDGFTLTAQEAESRPAVSDLSLRLRKGEILGLAGLQGSGASELLLALFGGWEGKVTGQALLQGKRLSIDSPRRAIEQGIALLTNDRKATGLVMSLSIVANVTLADLPELSPWGWRSPRRETETTRALGERLSWRTPSPNAEVGLLSGGNQQKVALAKWLQTNPRLLLLDEPTRGIDIAAKHEVYQLLNDLTVQGIAILLITSELPELLAMSDRIAVLHRGVLMAEYSRAEATPEKLLAAAMGGFAGRNGH